MQRSDGSVVRIDAKDIPKMGSEGKGGAIDARDWLATAGKPAEKGGSDKPVTTPAEEKKLPTGQVSAASDKPEASRDSRAEERSKVQATLDSLRANDISRLPASEKAKVEAKIRQYEAMLKNLS